MVRKLLLALASAPELFLRLYQKIDDILEQQFLLRKMRSLSIYRTYKLYWSLYGGRKALLSSPYIYIALLITILVNPFWGLDANGVRPWCLVILGIVPNILGFSMGGMAITLSFVSHISFKTLTQSGSRSSIFMVMTANFFHFILMQTLAILLAILASAYPSYSFISFVGFWTFSYAILVSLATASQLLSSARIFNATALPHQSDIQSKDDEKH